MAEFNSRAYIEAKSTDEGRIAWNRHRTKVRRSTDAGRIKDNRRIGNSSIIRVIKRKMRVRLIVALRGGYKGGSIIHDLGMPIPDFKDYIAQQFHSGMTWENWGSVWELDHRCPLRVFDLASRCHSLIAFHYSNYQPLLIADHASKSASESTRYNQGKPNESHSTHVA